jgi:predicted NBD/HSP70 family sugar kinase
LKDFLSDSSPKNKAYKEVYQLIHKKGPITKANLLPETKLTVSTLARIIEELMENQYIRKYSLESSGRGRPAVLYHINEKCSFSIGISITRMKVSVVLFDLLYNQLDRESFVMTSMHHPDFVLSKLKAIIIHFMEEHHINVNQLLGIGIASIGVLDKAKGIVLQPGGFLSPEWKNTPVVKILGECIPVKIVLENLPNAAVLGEYRYTNSIEDSMLYWISGGWGLGASAIVQNEILPIDINGLMHMVVDINGRKCSCGKKGCLITYTSPYNLLNKLIARKSSLKISKEKLATVSIDEIMEFLKQGDTITDEILMESAYYLGVGISNIVNLFRSELIIIKGPLIETYPSYFEKVTDSVATNAYNKNALRFSHGILQENAAAIGAAMYIQEGYF